MNEYVKRGLQVSKQQKRDLMLKTELLNLLIELEESKKEEMPVSGLTKAINTITEINKNYFN